jgi:8-oxo-dGTP diphosphatase
MNDEKSHYIAVTGIVRRNDKYLIVKRSLKEKAFPGFWTVPGGKLTKKDYIQKPKDTGDAWYNVLENVLEREVKEETGLQINNIGYLLSLVYMRSDNIPTTVISLYADYDSGDISLAQELDDYKWVSVEELKNYQLISGIREEIEMVDKNIKTKEKNIWRGKYNNPEEKSLRDGIQES